MGPRSFKGIALEDEKKSKTSVRCSGTKRYVGYT